MRHLVFYSPVAFLVSGEEMVEFGKRFYSGYFQCSFYISCPYPGADPKQVCRHTDRSSTNVWVHSIFGKLPSVGFGSPRSSFVRTEVAPVTVEVCPEIFGKLNCFKDPGRVVGFCGYFKKKNIPPNLYMSLVSQLHLKNCPMELISWPNQ